MVKTGSRRDFSSVVAEGECDSRGDGWGVEASLRRVCGSSLGRARGVSREERLECGEPLQLEG